MTVNAIMSTFASSIASNSYGELAFVIFVNVTVRNWCKKRPTLRLANQDLKSGGGAEYLHCWRATEWVVDAETAKCNAVDLNRIQLTIG